MILLTIQLAEQLTVDPTYQPPPWCVAAAWPPLINRGLPVHPYLGLPVHQWQKPVNVELTFGFQTLLKDDQWWRRPTPSNADVCE